VSEPAVDDALVAELARSAVLQTAPEELPLFRATSEAYFKDPESLTRKRSGDELLGFGVGEALMLVTPIALTVAREVLNFVVEQVRSQAREHGKETIDRLADRLLDHEPEAAGQSTAGGGTSAASGPEAPELTDEQLEQVRALALEKAQQLKLAPDKAQLLADSLVGSLATA
jgi:hypothetical protein